MLSCNPELTWRIFPRWSAPGSVGLRWERSPRRWPLSGSDSPAVAAELWPTVPFLLSVHWRGAANKHSKLSGLQWKRAVKVAPGKENTGKAPPLLTLYGVSLVCITVETAAHFRSHGHIPEHGTTGCRDTTLDCRHCTNTNENVSSYISSLLLMSTPRLCSRDWYAREQWRVIYEEKRTTDRKSGGGMEGQGWRLRDHCCRFITTNQNKKIVMICFISTEFVEQYFIGSKIKH